MRGPGIIAKLLTYVVLTAVGCTMLIPFFWMCTTALKPDDQMERDNWIPTKKFTQIGGVEYVIENYKEAEDGAGLYRVRRKTRPPAQMTRVMKAADLADRLQNNHLLMSGVEYKLLEQTPLNGDEEVRVRLQMTGKPEMEFETSTLNLTESRRSAKEFTYRPAGGAAGSVFTVKLVQKINPMYLLVSGHATTPRLLSGVYSDNDIIRKKTIHLTREITTEYISGKDGLDYAVTEKKRLSGSAGKYRVRPTDVIDLKDYGERTVTSDEIALSKESKNRWLVVFDKRVGPVDVELIEVIEPAEYEIAARHVRTLKDRRISEEQVETRFAPQWRNFKRTVEQVNIGRSYLNSLFVAILIVVGQVFTSSLAAYAFSRLRFPFRDTLFMGYLATMMIPGAVTLIPVFIVVKSLPLLFNNIFDTTWFSYNLYFMAGEIQSYVGKPLGLDSYFALIVPGLFSAYGTFMLRQFFMSLPRELEDAARIDGCGTWGIYTNVILPLSKPALAALTIFTFLGAWRNFLWPMIVTSNPQLETLPVMLASFMGVTGTQWNLLMAGTLLFLGPMIIVFLFGQKFFVEGIQLGGVKG